MPASTVSEISLRQSPRIRNAAPEIFTVNLPKRIFQWLYSFSLIIFIILTGAFIVVTPLDIIIQTYGAPSTGIKMFIIAAACAIFLLALIVFYFSRLFLSRDAVNQIPSKSVYVPLEKHDLPADVIKYIDANLQKCADIKIRAGPLYNISALNFPGMLPPEYIQERNSHIGKGDQGTLLPPNCVYEDILDSLALRIRLDGALFTDLDIPVSYTFREVIIAVYHHMSDTHQHLTDTVTTMWTLIYLYEKMRFSGELIAERDIVSFLLAMERFFLGFINNHRRNSQITLGQDQRSSIIPMTELDQLNVQSRRGLFDTRLRFPLFDEESRANGENLVHTPYHSVSRVGTHLTRTSTGTSSISTSRKYRLSVSTNGSVIRDHLAYRRPSYNPIGEGVEGDESLRAYSGYWTDSEGDTMEM